MAKVVRQFHGIMHRVAWCDDCDWRDEGYTTAHKTIVEHVKKTGHKAVIENGSTTEYSLES